MNCPNCHVFISTRDREKAEQVSADVKRLECPSCETWIYLLTFKFALDLIKERDAQTRIFHCAKCGINTAGIPPDKDSADRYCPICHFLFSEAIKSSDLLKRRR